MITITDESYYPLPGLDIPLKNVITVEKTKPSPQEQERDLIGVKGPKSKTALELEQAMIEAHRKKLDLQRKKLDLQKRYTRQPASVA